MKNKSHKIKFYFFIFFSLCLLSPLCITTSFAEEGTNYEDYLTYQDIDEPEPSSIEMIQPEFGSLFNNPNDSSSSIPSYYGDSSKVSSVKDQGSFGTCWAFSALSAMEASYQRNNNTGTSFPDFSEFHLAYFMYHTAEDPLGGTKGDLVSSPDPSNFMQTGGNSYYSMWTLLNWKGAAAEITCPYPINNSFTPPNVSFAYNDLAHLQNVYRISYKDKATIKRLIMEYGALGASYHHNGKYYDSSANAYYCYDKLSTNHAISIIGWDDDFSKNNFKSGNQPSGNGAWLMKNSWGTSSGKNGYYWISYEDRSLSDTWYVFDAESNNNYSNNYQYDGGIGVGYFEVSQGSIANIFTAQGNETLQAVGFYALPMTNYSIQIYKGGNTSNPTSGTPMLSSVQTGSLLYEGYHTISLNESIPLSSNDLFSVVIELKGTNSSRIGIPFDVPINGWLISDPKSTTGQSFYKSGSNWYDAHIEEGMNVRLKAYTSNQSVTTPITQITLNENSINLNPGETFQLAASLQPTNHDDALTFNVDNSTVASISRNGLVTAKRGGTAKVTVRGRDANSVSASCIVNVTSTTSMKKTFVFSKLPNIIYKNWSYLLTLDSRFTKLNPYRINYSIQASNCIVESLGTNGLGGCELTVNNVQLQGKRGETVTLIAEVFYLDRKGNLKTKKFTKKVRAENPISTISIQYTNGDEIVGYEKNKTVALSVLLNNGDSNDVPTNQKVKWLVTNANGEIDKNGRKIVSVNGKGVVKFKAAGSTYVMAAATGSYDKTTKTYDVYDLIRIVCPPIQSANFQGVPSATLGKGSYFDLLPYLDFQPGNAFNVDKVKLKWSTSDPSIVNVNSKGMARAGNRSGTATITVTLTDAVPRGETPPTATIQLRVL